MAGDDWLALPSETPPAMPEDLDSPGRFTVVPADEFAPVQPARELVVAEPSKPKLPVVRQEKNPAGRSERSRFAVAWRKLTSRQRKYIENLVKFGFNKGKALKALAIDGLRIERHTPMKWEKNNEAYSLVLKTIKEQMVGEAVEPANLLLTAHQILELAIDGTPRFDKDGQFKGNEPQLDTALRANEQKMKATGMLRGEQSSTRVTVRFVNLAGEDGSRVIDAETATDVPE